MTQTTLFAQTKPRLRIIEFFAILLLGCFAHSLSAQVILLNPNDFGESESSGKSEALPESEDKVSVEVEPSEIDLDYGKKGPPKDESSPFYEQGFDYLTGQQLEVARQKKVYPRYRLAFLLSQSNFSLGKSIYTISQDEILVDNLEELSTGLTLELSYQARPSEFSFFALRFGYERSEITPSEDLLSQYDASQFENSADIFRISFLYQMNLYQDEFISFWAGLGPSLARVFNTRKAPSSLAQLSQLQATTAFGLLSTLASSFAVGQTESLTLGADWSLWSGWGFHVGFSSRI